MPWGKIAVVGLATLVTLGLGLVVTQPWNGTRPVDALELDQAWKDDGASDAEIGDDDDDGDDDTGTRTRSGARDASRTDDGRDGTREGDTRGSRGTGTANDSVSIVANTGGADSATNGGGAASVSRDSVSGGGTT